MKKMKSAGAIAAVLMVSSVSLQAQEPLSTTTKTVKVAPGVTKTTVITKEKGTKKHVARHRKAVVHHEAVESETSRELRELREKQAAQQAQIDALTQANAAANAQLAAAQTTAAGAEAQAQTATQQAQSVTTTVQANTDAVAALKSNVTDLQTTNVGLANTISANKVELTDKIESPTTIHYKGVTITPVAFFASEGVWRQKSLSSDINTPFNSIPYDGADQAHISEFNFSARQSRLGGLFEGKAANYKLSGYFESDFLGAGTTSNDNQSNSYVFRIRQAWGQAANNSGTALTGGQMWSLVTEDGTSTDVRTEKLPNTVDSQYMVGFSWERQPGFRLQQRFGNSFLGSAATVAFAVEQPQIVNLKADAGPSNYIIAGAGTTGGLYNGAGSNGSTETAGVQNYTNNVAPDVIAKLALDFPHSHFELGGLARFFRERIYPTVAGEGPANPAVPGAAAYNDTVTGGGGFASFRVNSKFLTVGASGMVGDGVGRYGSAQLPDVTVHPNGVLEPIRNAHGLLSIETHPAPKLDLYAYYGGEYAQRTLYATGLTGASAFTGYGSPADNDTECAAETYTATSSGNGGTINAATSADCSGETRYIQEGMIGFTYRAISSPKYGRIQYQATYSYLARKAWTGVTSGTYGSATATFGQPYTVEPMVHISMRYYIP